MFGPDLVVDHLAANRSTGAFGAAAAPAPGAALDLVVGFALGALLLGDQCLSVGDRNLVVIGMDFAEGQETVSVAGVFDKGRLQRRLDPRYLGEVDVAAQLAAAR